MSIPWQSVKEGQLYFYFRLVIRQDVFFTWPLLTAQWARRFLFCSTTLVRNLISIIKRVLYLISLATLFSTAVDQMVTMFDQCGISLLLTSLPQSIILGGKYIQIM